MKEKKKPDRWEAKNLEFPLWASRAAFVFPTFKNWKIGNLCSVTVPTNHTHVCFRLPDRLINWLTVRDPVVLMLFIFQEQIEDLRKACPGCNPAQLSQLLSVAHALSSSESQSLGLPDFPLDNIHLLAPIINHCKFLDSYNLLTRLYPYGLMLGRDGREAVKGVLSTFQVEENLERTSQVETVELHENGSGKVGIKSGRSSATITVSVVFGMVGMKLTKCFRFLRDVLTKLCRKITLKRKPTRLWLLILSLAIPPEICAYWDLGGVGRTQ